MVFGVTGVYNVYLLWDEFYIGDWSTLVTLKIPLMERKLNFFIKLQFGP